VGFFGPPNIQRMKKHGNIRGLIKVMQKERDSRVVGQAIQALGEIGDEQAIQPLLDEVQADHYGSSDQAAAALVSMAGRLSAIDLRSRLVEEWTSMLCPEGLHYPASSVHYDGDDDEFNRAWAREERHRINADRIWDLGAGRRQVAARALGMLGDERSVEALVQCLLTHHLSSYDDHTRRFALQALRKINSPHAIELLQKVVNGSEELARLMID